MWRETQAQTRDEGAETIFILREGEERRRRGGGDGEQWLVRHIQDISGMFRVKRSMGIVYPPIVEELIIFQPFRLFVKLHRGRRTTERTPLQGCGHKCKEDAGGRAIDKSLDLEMRFRGGPVPSWWHICRHSFLRRAYNHSCDTC